MKKWADHQADTARTYWTELHRVCDGCTRAMARASGVALHTVHYYKRLYALPRSTHSGTAGPLVLGRKGLVQLQRGTLRPHDRFGEHRGRRRTEPAPPPADAAPEGAGS